MDVRRFLELEFQAVRQLYDGEKSRRETVRTSLAIPFAAVAFIVSSMGTLVRVARADTLPEPTTPVEWLSVGSAVLAIALLVYALSLIWRIDYAANDTDGVLLDLSSQAASAERELAEAIPDPERRQAEAEIAAIRGAIRAYGASLFNLRASNDANLALQGRVLRALLLCVGATVLAVGLALGDAILY
ncbi:hypothetical protein LX81_00061 [Palleronia aestuarii]|uniref:SMODS and SLOG-associating 2TM effector domain-containing protein n=1 Tax=Palleronia aestuarii TaxID=568105 RepID=A0A2W7NGS4_9RHOB|nr:hypothetical protein [Palleronia aestuarii]PZX19605.1 hypothetical protein LX81_00061 [Palleronia aestuarii]